MPGRAARIVRSMERTLRVEGKVPFVVCGIQSSAVMDESCAVKEHVGLRARHTFGDARIVQGIEHKGFYALRHVAQQICVHVSRKDLRAFSGHGHSAGPANALACRRHKRPAFRPNGP